MNDPCTVCIVTSMCINSCRTFTEYLMSLDPTYEGSIHENLNYPYVADMLRRREMSLTSKKDLIWNLTWEEDTFE